MRTLIVFVAMMGHSILCSAALAGEPATIADEMMVEKQMMEKKKMMHQSGPSDIGECLTDELAVGGYDLVSYHQPGGPVKGSGEFAERFEGLVYRFASDDHRRLFSSDPEKYLPAYGGWCAISLALGSLTCPDYTNFIIENGKLLVFEITGFTNGRVLWESNPDQFKVQADDNYRKLVLQR